MTYEKVELDDKELENVDGGFNFGALLTPFIGSAIDVFKGILGGGSQQQQSAPQQQQQSAPQPAQPYAQMPAGGGYGPAYYGPARGGYGMPAGGGYGPAYYGPARGGSSMPEGGYGYSNW